MKMKAMVAGALATLLCVVACLPSFAVATSDDVALGDSVEGISAESYVVMDVATGTVLFSSNATTEMPMASTTKIMTTLLALEEDVTAQFQADAESLQVEGSSMGLLTGDTVTLLDLCYGMMLASGNDAATLTANYIAGSTESFADLMNQKAAELGMEQTNFVNPSGLPDDEHYSTAYDMALLACAAIQNETFAEICATESITLALENGTYWLSNHNQLLTTYDGCIGMKTGYTIAAGRCLVSVAERDGRQLVCVTLNAPDDWNDHRILLDAGFALETYTIWSGDQTVTLPVTGGTATEVTASIDTIYDYQEGTAIVLASPFLYAPIQAGDQVAELLITTFDHSYTVPLYADQSVEQKTTQAVSVATMIETLIRPIGFTMEN